MLRFRIGPKLFKTVKPAVFRLKDVNYDIGIVQYHPETVFFSLASSDMPFGLKQHLFLYLIGNGSHLHTRVGMTNDKKVTDRAFKFSQVHAKHILRLFIEHRLCYDPDFFHMLFSNPYKGKDKLVLLRLCLNGKSSGSKKLILPTRMPVGTLPLQ